MITPRNIYRRLKRQLVGFINRRRTVSKVFSDIYAKNRWGGEAGEFYSGGGSGNREIADEYVDVIRKLADSEGFRGLRFVDLGCGDFRIGSRLVGLASHYTGIDVVEGLIEHNKKIHGGSNISFECRDIIANALPEGDVCFIRQVLQHLSNEQIARILRKLGGYRWVFITEHLPTDFSAAQPNLDKVHGTDIRLMRNSGVYLDLPPFSLPGSALLTVLEIPGHGFDGGVAEPGILRTTMYKPGRST